MYCCVLPQCTKITKFIDYSMRVRPKSAVTTVSSLWLGSTHTPQNVYFSSHLYMYCCVLPQCTKITKFINYNTLTGLHKYTSVHVPLFTATVLQNHFLMQKMPPKWCQSGEKVSYIKLNYLLEHLLAAESERQRMQWATASSYWDSLQKGLQVLFNKPKVTKKCLASI